MPNRCGGGRGLFVAETVRVPHGRIRPVGRCGNATPVDIRTQRGFPQGVWNASRPTFPQRSSSSSIYFLGSSHKCMHDFAPGRSATAVGRRCGCARAGTQRCSRLSLSRRPPARAPLLVGGPARRQPDQTQAADAMALTWRRTEKASGRGLDFRRRSTLEPNPSLTVQPPWNWQPRHDSAGWCGRIFREPATPPQIQTVLVGHVSH